MAKQTAVSGWVAVTDALPKALQTVWLTNGKGWCCLGCLIEDAEGWHWAESNGVIYIENGEIVSECESEDLDVNFWHELPKPPFEPPKLKNGEPAYYKVVPSQSEVDYSKVKQTCLCGISVNLCDKVIMPDYGKRCPCVVAHYNGR